VSSVERDVAVANELGLPARCSELSVARQFTGETAAACGFDADSCYEFVYAVNEAVTNALMHGAPDALGLIYLSSIVDADRLTFAVRDCGTFAMPTLATDTRSEHGRGFALMASLMDEVQLHSEPGSTIVRLAKLRG
jgi:anti-sigma regulatory factor (Ser/Thr protein kinase)